MFLPDKHPLEKLNNNKSWHQLTQNLPTLNVLKTVGQHCDNLPLFDMNLSTIEEYRRAYVMLALIVHSYVWNNKVGNAPSVLPKKLALPFYLVSKKLGLPPVLTHAAVDLWNWRLKDKTKEQTVENMELISSITGSPSESCFYLVMTEIEYIGGKIINDLLTLPCLVKQNKTNEILSILKMLNITITDITRIIPKMYTGCLPEIFYNVLRKYLNGWAETPVKHLIFEGVVVDNPEDGISAIVQHNGNLATSFVCKGGSAAQSSLIQFFDLALNVKHESECTSEFLNEMLKYMPDEHRNLLKKYKDKTDSYPLDKYINTCNNDVMLEIYNNCTNNLVKFRKAHLGLVYLYIIQMKNKLNTENNINIESKGLKGTGGTELKSFLNTCIKETKDKKIV